MDQQLRPTVEGKQKYYLRSSMGLLVGGTENPITKVLQNWGKLMVPVKGWQKGLPNNSVCPMEQN